MRLTLRGMLTFLDKHCDWKPAEKAEFGKRIDDSKFASELVERIRVSLRRPRLGAPKVEGRGIGLDANTVAEYLEGALPVERIADFEKLCLESDVHLAEVAACHEILSDVVAGIRPPIRFGLKETIIALEHPDGEERFRRQRVQAGKASAAATAGTTGRAASRSVEAAAASVLAPPVAAGDSEVAQATEVAQELAATRGPSWRTLALALGIAFLLVLGGLRVLGPFDHRHPLALWGGGDERLIAQGSGSGGEESPAAAEGVAPTALSDSDSVADGKSSVRSTESDDVENAPSSRPAKEELETRDSDHPPAAAKDRALNDLEVAPVKAKNDVVAGKVVDRTEPAKGAAVEVAEPVAEVPARPAAANGGTKKRIEKMAEGKAGAAEESKPGVAGASEVGRLVSEEQVIAHIDHRDSLWYRLTRGTMLNSAETYVALPYYRPQILVPNSTQVMVVGPAAFTLLPPPPGTMGGGIAVQRGRAILAPAGMPGTRVPLTLADHSGHVVFADTNAELAVEVRRYLPPGADPNEVAPQVARLFYARRGAVQWQPEGSAPIQITPDHVLALIDGEEPVLEVSGFPTWTEVRNISKLDRDAFEQLEKLLPPERPLLLSLHELQSFRKTEIRSLAARSLATLGEYESLFRELANDQQHSYWDRAVDDLREALAQGPAEAERIREALRRIRVEDAKAIFRLLRDYSPDQLAREGAATELVGYLDHKSLDVRVLAFESLRRITGGTLNYRPEWPAERRKIPSQKWRDRLKEGQIAYKYPPAPPPFIERRAPAAKPVEPAKP